MCPAVYTKKRSLKPKENHNTMDTRKTETMHIISVQHAAVLIYVAVVYGIVHIIESFTRTDVVPAVITF